MEQSTASQSQAVQKKPELSSVPRTGESPLPEQHVHVTTGPWQASEQRPLGAHAAPVQRSAAPRAGGWASADRRPLQQRALQQKLDPANTHAASPASTSIQLSKDPAAPVQLGVVGPTQTGKALTKNKAALVVADDGTEKAKLTAANSFESLADLLTGNPVFRNPPYKEQAEQKILAKVSANAKAAKGYGNSYWQGRYLIELLNPATGFEPTIVSRVAMALGLLTHGSLGRWVSKPGDPDEVRILLESGAVTVADARFIKEHPDIQSALTNFERLSFRIQKLLNALLGYVEAKAEILEQVNAGAQPGQEAEDLKAATLSEEQKTKLNQAADEFLSMVANRYADKVGDSSQKLKLFNELQAWAQSATQGERDYVLKASSKFNVELKACLSHERDQIYARGIITRTELVTPEAVKDAQDTKNKDAIGYTGNMRDVAALITPGGATKLEEISVQTAEQIGEVLELIAVMSREGERGKSNYFRSHKRVAIAKLEESSDQARELYLTLYAQKNLGIDLKALPEADRHAARVRALDRFYTDLYDNTKYGFEQEAAEKFLSRLRTKGELGTVYRELVLFLRKEPDFDDRISEMNERLASATPSDIVQIKGDAWLLQKTVENLKQARTPANIKKHGEKSLRLCQILGLDVNQLQSLNVAQEAENAQKAVEAIPATYSGGINAECDNTFKNHGNIAGQMHRAYMASQDKAIKTGKPEDQEAFMKEVLDGLSGSAKAWLAARTSDEVGSKLTWAERLLATGDNAPTTEWRVAVSTRGIQDRSEEAENTIADLQGVHILDLSNFNDFEVLWSGLNAVLEQEPDDSPSDPFLKAQHEQWASQVETLYQGIDTFTFDLNPSIVAKLEAEHNRITGGRTSTTHNLVSKARKKLADALSGDSAVQARFLKLGMHVQDFLMLTNRVKGFKALDEETLANRGLQWSSVSVKSVLRKEANWRLKGTFKEKSDKQAQVTRDTLKDKLKDQAKNQEEQEQAFAHTADVDERVEDYDRRKDSFEAMRAKYNGRLMMVVGAILAVGFSMAISAATAGIASPFLVALVSFAMGLAQKAITASIEAAISGQGLNLSPDACWRLAIQTGIELGVAMAGAAITQQIKSVWDANIAGKDWELLHKENDDFMALTKVADKGGKDWYDDGGFLKVEGLFAEAGKEAGVNFIKGTLDGMGSATVALFTEAKPLEAVKASLKDAAKGTLISTAQGFTTTLATAKLDEALAKDEITSSEAAKEERNTNQETFNGDSSSENEALLNKGHGEFGKKMEGLLDKKKITSSLVTSPVGTLTEMGTEALVTKIPGLREGVEPEELDFQMKQTEEMLQVDSMVGQLEALETALTKLSGMEALLGQATFSALRSQLRGMLLRVTKSRVELTSSLNLVKNESQKGQLSPTLKSIVPALQSVARDVLTEGRTAITQLKPAISVPGLDAAKKSELEHVMGMRSTLQPLVQNKVALAATRKRIEGFLRATNALQRDYDDFNAKVQEFNTHLTTLGDANALSTLVQSIDVFVTELMAKQTALAEVKTRLEANSTAAKEGEGPVLEAFNGKWYSVVTSKVDTGRKKAAATNKAMTTTLDAITSAVQTGGSSLSGNGDLILSLLAKL